MSSAFAVDQRLLDDTHHLTDLPLSRLLLMDDARWPWLVLVPRRAGLTELVELDSADRLQLLAEIDLLVPWVRRQPAVQKLNIAALGNVVPQLHVHLIGRHPGDAAWPRPVWGTPGRRNWTAAEVDAVRVEVAALAG